MQFINEYKDAILWIFCVFLFLLGYYYGHSVGHSRGFKAGRVAARRHPSLRNERN